MRSTLFAIIIFAFALTAAQATTTLTVKVWGLRKQGQVFVYLYNQDDGFPTSPEKAFKTITLPVRESDTLFAKFEGLAPGDYAVAVMHDENGNGQIDTNWIGIPKEGLGVSNNAKGVMGPPKFKDAKVTVPAGKKELSIPVKYR
ncbi:MAG TPA: DUF2141 domain-containing protein [bacterium]|nr:DUF2141 domain-containing protein [bacterium]